MSSIPCWFKCQTSALPMKPAPPVTMIIYALPAIEESKSGRIIPARRSQLKAVNRASILAWDRIHTRFLVMRYYLLSLLLLLTGTSFARAVEVELVASTEALSPDEQ